MSFTLALVVLFSTMSFTVNMHYCGDILVETAILHKAKGCGMDMEKPLEEGCSITKMNCCNDEQTLVDGQNELKLQVDTISLEQQLFIASFVYTYHTLFEDIAPHLTLYKQYKPPRLSKQLFKLDESYLI